MLWIMPESIAYYTAIKTKPLIIYLYDKKLQEELEKIYIKYKNELI